MNIDQEKTKRIALLMGYSGWDRKYNFSGQFGCVLFGCNVD